MEKPLLMAELLCALPLLLPPLLKRGALLPWMACSRAQQRQQWRWWRQSRRQQQQQQWHQLAVTALTLINTCPRSLRLWRPYMPPPTAASTFCFLCINLRFL